MMSRRPSPLPDSLPESFSVAQTQDAGVSPRRLRARDLASPFRGVRSRPPAESAAAVDDDASPGANENARLRLTIQRAARAYAARAVPGILYTHVTAAVIWDLPLPLRLLRRGAEAIDVAVLGERRAPKGVGVRGHQLRAELTRTGVRRGLRVAAPASVWVQLAPLLSVGELVELGDAVVHIPRRRGMHRGTPADALAARDDLVEAMEAGRRVGAARLRAALGLIRVGAASPPETRIRLACVRRQLPEPLLDVDVFGVDGRPIGFTELAFPDHGVLVEYEGDHHRRSPKQWQRDIEKHAACVAAGWEVVRLTAADLHRDAAPAAAKIAAALARGELRRSSVPWGRVAAADAAGGDG
ncbi:hypothetical protein AS96_06510 [Microbacterium sp. MRS-1]|nr:hypothetical protein AS96_06510 [Microbacterium sp. MRS-1]